MTCRTCGADLADDAKFCHQCGTAVGDDTPTEIVTPAEAEADVQLEETAEAAEAHDPAVEHAPIDGSPADAPEDVDVRAVDLPTLPRDETQTGITSPALQATVPTPPRPRREPRQRRPLEEQGAWEEFTGAVLPLLRAPRFTGNLLAAVVAFGVSFAAALIAWAIFRGGGEGNEGLLLPGFVEAGRDGVGVLALLTFAFHQVPFLSGGDMQHTAPLLLALIPLAGCAIGVVVARRLMPCSSRGAGFLTRTLPFALLYALLLFIWSLFEAQDWHAAHGRAVLAGIVFALLGAWLAEHWLARTGEGPAAPDAAATDEPPVAEPQAPRLREALRVASRVFACMIALASLGWMVGSLVAQARSGDSELTGSAVASSVLQVLEGGFEAVGFGVLAEGTPFGFMEGDAGWRVFELSEPLPDAAAAIYLIVAVAVVVVGGLFSGFSIARRVQPRSRNDHALLGAVTGLVWAAAMLLAQFVVLSRYGDGDDVYTVFDGTETFLLSLLLGVILGGLGGLLVATSRGDAATTQTAQEVEA